MTRYPTTGPGDVPEGPLDPNEDALSERLDDLDGDLRSGAISREEYEDEVSRLTGPREYDGADREEDDR